MRTAILILALLLLPAGSAVPARACACSLECPEGYVCPDDLEMCVPASEETS